MLSERVPKLIVEVSLKVTKLTLLPKAFKEVPKSPKFSKACSKSDVALIGSVTLLLILLMVFQKAKFL
jgi:hypothetical protein